MTTPPSYDNSGYDYASQPHPSHPYPPSQPPPQGYPQGPPGGYPQGPQGGYPQGPPQGYPQGAPPGQPGGAAYPAAVHSTNIVYTAQGGYGPDPVSMRCNFCHADITTTTEYELGTLTWIIVGSLFAAGFVCLCTWLFCCIPCCIPSCKDVLHMCPNCKRQLGRYNRIN